MSAATPGQALVPVDSVYLYHWRFDRGEEFGLYRRKADAEATAEARAAEHPGEGLFEVLGMAVLDRTQPQPATPGQALPEPARAGFADFLASQGYDEDGMFDADEMELAFETGWQVAQAAVAAQERPAPGDVGYLGSDALAKRYGEALQRIVDAVTDPDAVDKLARNALGLTRVGKPSQRGTAQPAAELAAAKLRETAADNIRLREQLAAVSEGAQVARKRWLDQAAMHERDAGRFDPDHAGEFSAKARVYRALADELAEIAGLPS